MTLPLKDLKNESSWINVAKTCAIIGVVLQHVNGFLYTDQRIFYSVWWVVALFIMIGGYNAMSSYENRGYIVMRRRLLGIGIPYIVATVIYQLFEKHHFDLYELVLMLLHFNASGPLYYVAAYLQLVLITPVLIVVIHYCEQINCTKRYLLAGVGIFSFCLLASQKSNIFEIAIGGGCLFAGPWLFFWFAGMLVRKLEKRINMNIGRLTSIVIYTILLCMWELVFVVNGCNQNFGPLFRGSGVGMTWANTLETVLVFFWFRAVVTHVESVKTILVKKVIDFFNYLGRHTLYVFLYHMLFISIFKGIMPPPKRQACESFMYLSVFPLWCLGR